MSTHYQPQHESCNYICGSYDHHHKKHKYKYKHHRDHHHHHHHHHHRHKKHNKNKKKQRVRVAPKPPIPLPLYCNQPPKHFISWIEPTYSSLKPPHTNTQKHCTKRNHGDGIQELHAQSSLQSSIQSVHSPSEISQISSKSSLPNNQIPTPKQSVYINDINQLKPTHKTISNLYAKNHTAPSNFYRHQVHNNNHHYHHDTYSFYDVFDYTNCPSIYPLKTLKKRKKKRKKRKKKQKKQYKLEKSEKSESENEIEYDYNIISDKNGEIYIDITIDLNQSKKKHSPPSLTYYNVLPSPSPSPPPSSSSSDDDSSSSCVKVILNRKIKRKSVIEYREQSINKHESILLEILKCGNRESVINAIRYARCDVLCYFLPLIAFTLCQSDKLEWRLSLLSTLRQRIVGLTDLKQSVAFLLQSYDNITEVKAVFSPLITDKTHKSSNDMVLFWNNIIKNNKQPTVITINNVNSIPIRDPINQLRAPICSIEIKKVINSNSKPLLISTFDSHNLLSTFILKYGDDLRKDKACQLVFKWMNHLWREKAHEIESNLNIKILTYKVIPMSRKLGCIELISDCIALRDISTLKVNAKDREKINNLIISCAGSYIATYIMGIRDRHFDNILIRKTDLRLFHIDMNYILGDTLPFYQGIDANQFGITKELYDLFGVDNYNIFIDLSCKAFQLLRQYNEEFINFTCLAFSYVCHYKSIRTHILKQLRMSQSDEKAKSWLKNTLIKAPFDVQTQLKNKIHKFATR